MSSPSWPAPVQALLEKDLTFEELIPQALEAICENMGWDYAAFWSADAKEHVLRCAWKWHSPQKKSPFFDDINTKITFRMGECLPGRVWSSGRPECIDIASDTRFERKPMALGDGLLSGCAVPITAGAYTFSVMEFYRREPLAADHTVVADMTPLAEELGRRARPKT